MQCLNSWVNGKIKTEGENRNFRSSKTSIKGGEINHGGQSNTQRRYQNRKTSKSILLEKILEFRSRSLKEYCKESYSQ